MKRIVLCCDGTWNRADQERAGEPAPTNVLRAAYLIAKAKADVPQIVSYDQGVGTGNTLDRLTGGAFGHGLEENIHEAYRFLVANYEPGDDLFLFGFSRGAFTARSIAGMIRKCGILRRSAVRHYRDALALYRDGQHPDDQGPTDFRAKHSVAGANEIPVTCIGVWDTVGALGIPVRGLRGLTRGTYQFHDTELSGTVRNAFHALAIDEHRGPFEPTLWQHEPKDGQTVEQVWFAGVHSDVGGGYAERGASDVPLQWMLDRAKDKAGLALDVEALAANPPHPNHTGPLHDSLNLFYRLSGIDRPIGLVTPPPGEPRVAPEPDPTQSVHQSVLDRWDADPRYRPANLRDYFTRTGDPRGA
ncbi:MAG TPA: DUF2235 domain-containing protein [Actinomycetota bacterium]